MLRELSKWSGLSELSKIRIVVYKVPDSDINYGLYKLYELYKLIPHFTTLYIPPGRHFTSPLNSISSNCEESLLKGILS